MAIVATVLDQGKSDVDGTTFTTGSITPTSGRLTLIFVSVWASGGGSPAPIVAGAGMNWSTYSDGTTVGQKLYDSNKGRIRALRADSGTPASGALTITTSVTCQACAWAVVEFVDAENGNALQLVSGTATSSTPSVTLSGANSANAVVGVFGADATATFTNGAGFSTIADQSTSTDIVRLAVEFLNAGQNTVDGTWGSSIIWAELGFELRYIAPGTVVGQSTRLRQFRRRRR
jgi:hypothetical protein